MTHASGDPTVTVVGHSYGSTTTGLALQHQGLAVDVDDVVLLGSPGVGGRAQGVADLGLRPDQLQVATASRDVIRLAAHTLLGADPLDPGFGGDRLRAESVERDGPGLGDLVGVADHSRYYDPGSESLYGLAEIVTGHPDRLVGDDLVAQRPNRSRTWLDPFPVGPFPVAPFPGPSPVSGPPVPPVVPPLLPPLLPPPLPPLPPPPSFPVLPPLGGSGTGYVDPELTRPPTGGHVHRVG